MPVVYVMSAVPALIAATSPVDMLMVATEALPLLHVPPVTGLLSVVVDPSHSNNVPVMAPGVVLTVIDFVATPVPQLFAAT
jgi:hypothetical protein